MPVELKQWMSGDPVSIEPGTSALAALDLLVDRGIRHLPVVDTEQRVIGVLTLDDLRAALPVSLVPLGALSPRERDLARDYTVAEVMTHAPTTILDNAPLVEAAERMAEERLGCLPVVDDKGRLAGIVTETDALYALVTTLRLDRVPEQQSHFDLLVDALARERERLAAQSDAEGGLDETATSRLDALEQALDRVARGTFSVCERCGGGIPLAVLRALPGVTLCTSCEGAERS